MRPSNLWQSIKEKENKGAEQKETHKEWFFEIHPPMIADSEITNREICNFKTTAALIKPICSEGANILDVLVDYVFLLFLIL